VVAAAVAVMWRADRFVVAWQWRGGEGLKAAEEEAE
jgi:hypothetical protein